jgi:nicotinamide mononucleotide adenylyltransferase
MEREGREMAAFVGRFAPIHIGHQMIIDGMVEKFGVKNCLILVGSSNSYNERTPYTFEEREKMIKTLYPEINVYPLPDMKPDLLYFDGTTNDAWLNQIKRTEKQLNAKFIFFGGSKNDLAVLSQKFKTFILIERAKKGLNISGTKVRETLDKGDMDELKRLVDQKILNMVIQGHHFFHHKI